MPTVPASSPALPASTERCSPIVDLRQYTLVPGTRDAFVELFDSRFIESQEAAGMRLIGQFRDLGDPNRFVWLRGFDDMAARERALKRFYLEGEAWRLHAEAARACMIDTSDALLLHPARPDTAFALPPAPARPALDAASPAGVVVATLYPHAKPIDEEALGFHEDVLEPLLARAGARRLGLFAIDHSGNNFPALPLREGEELLVSFHAHADLAAYHAHLIALKAAPAWRSEVLPALIARLRGRAQVLRLAPTSRSQLRP